MAKERYERMSSQFAVGVSAEERLEQAGTSRIVEGRRGPGRRRWIEDLIASARAEGAEALSVSCRLETAGVWAGVADIFRALLPAMEAADPAIIRRHSYALALMVPELRVRFPLKDGSLTDSSPVKERVRSYPVDRAYRLVHGLIDLLAEWLPEGLSRQGRRLVVVCDDFDGAGALVRRFFRELVRRRLGGLPLDLVFVVADGGGAAAATELDGRGGEITRLDLEPEEERMDRAEMARQADELEAFVQENLGSREHYLPRLIQCCIAADRMERANHWRGTTLMLYNHYGFYEDALFFGEPLIADLDRTSDRANTFGRWHIISGLFNALVALGRAERAYQLVHDEALMKLDQPNDLVSVYYTLAMLHCRFLPKKDLAKAEEYLEKSLAIIEHTTLSESEKHYLAVFNLNGIAFIRHLQGRVEEATDLCRQGFERLNEHLTEEQYRLHRSVLLYNIAQVHTSTRSYEEAVKYYNAAMEIDPRYSEYYNERGSVYLKMGRFADAAADYRKAMELSEPYQEVYTNLGQAYKLLGDAEKAIAAYSSAIDLDPRQILPLLGRAQAHEMAGHAEAALADYTAVLSLDPSDPQTWSNRAVLHYEGGRIADAVADLDQAIARAPGLPDLYANRALALADLGRAHDAAADHQTYLKLRPDAEDREEIVLRIHALREMPVERAN